MKKLISSITCVLALVLLLAACGGGTATSPAPEASPTPEATPEVTATPEPAPVVDENLPLICQGVFEYTMTPEGYDAMHNFFHFYPNGVFYAGQFNNGQFAAGYYEIKDEPRDYTDKEGNTFTAPQTIYMTLVDGSEYETVSYDADKGAIGEIKHVYDNIFLQNKESELTSADENGVALTEYMLGDDEYSLLRFMHNGTFQDTVGAMVEGNWILEGNVYTMTDAESNNTYTLTVNADATGTYVDLDGATQTLNLVKAAEALMTFRGATTATYGDMIITISCFDGGKASMNMNYGGRDTVTDGTWELAADYSHVTLVLDGTEHTAPLKMPEQTFEFELTTSDGATDVTVLLTTAEEASTVYTFVGENNENVIMECYSNGTCAVIYVGMGTVSEGTWVMDTSAGPLPQWTVELADTFEGAAVTVETDYATKFFFNYKNSSGQLEETLALPFSALG